jgi:hypothetical protein
MTIDEVMAMADGELIDGVLMCFGWRKGILPDGRPCWRKDEDIIVDEMMSRPDWPNDIAAAWELVESAKSGQDGVGLWDLYQAMEALTADEPEESLTDAPITGLCLLAHLSPRFITRAFVMAASE